MHHISSSITNQFYIEFNQLKEVKWANSASICPLSHDAY